MRRRKTSLRYGIKGIILTCVAATALVTSVGSAAAQGIFEALFGRLWTGPTAYADPNPFAGRSIETTRPDGSGIVFCVRACDGRYFSIQRHAGSTPAQVCSSFCPASATKIYSGSSIDKAVAPDGKRYGELATAFLYREKLVPGCSCNGKDAFGLVSPPIAEDPTLRDGDIVATNGGLMAYNGEGSGKQASFTPIADYSALAPDLRRQLTETKILPAEQKKPAPPPVRQADAAPRSGKNKRVQLDR